VDEVLHKSRVHALHSDTAFPLATRARLTCSGATASFDPTPSPLVAPTVEHLTLLAVDADLVEIRLSRCVAGKCPVWGGASWRLPAADRVAKMEVCRVEKQACEPSLLLASVPWYATAGN